VHRIASSIHPLTSLTVISTHHHQKGETAVPDFGGGAAVTKGPMSSMRMGHETQTAASSVATASSSSVAAPSTEVTKHQLHTTIATTNTIAKPRQQQQQQ
jgi:hypothetical protein